MDKEKLLQIAERNLKKAQKALEANYNRKGIADDEKKNLVDNVEFAEMVYDLIAYHAKAS